MEVRNRQGVILQNATSSKSQRFLYKTKFGRFLLKILIAKWVSVLGGFYMNSRFSKIHIKKFIKKNQIDMNRYEKRKYRSYNDFFTRQLALKPFLTNDQHDFISPCDGKLLVYPITKEGVFQIKERQYNIVELLKDEALANQFESGYILIYRLSVDNYHRYIFIDDGNFDKEVRIKGKLHTVHPIAHHYYPIYHENSRVYTLLSTVHFGDVIQMEVGALMVGKIQNYPNVNHHKRGDEKGMFLFGGSTVCVFVKKNQVIIDDIFINHSRQHIETTVSIGEKVGHKHA